MPGQSEKILSFLNPLKIQPGIQIDNFDTLLEIVAGAPPHTILPEDFFGALLTDLPAAGNVLAGGDWVEVGVWKGGGALFLAALMRDWQIDRELYLYDTFGAVPVGGFSHEKDIEFARRFSMGEGGRDYRHEVEELFVRFGLNRNLRFVPCDIVQPPPVLPEKISFLLIDVDFYEPTLGALQAFYDRVLPGGIIILDDYYMPLLNCREAVDAFLAEKKIDPRVHTSRFSSFALKIVKPLE